MTVAVLGCAVLAAACGNGAPAPGATKGLTTANTTSTSIGPSSRATGWSAPIATAAGANLESVSCPSVTFCIAIDGSGRTFTYIAGRFAAGKALNPVVVPGAAPTSATFVSCVSSAFCMAVPNGTQTVTGKGSAYGPVWGPAVAVPGAQQLQALSCSSAMFCMTVDGQGDSFVFNGAGWSATAGAWGGASALSCVTSSFCVATEGGGIAGWTGSSWSQPGSQDQTGQLLSVSCTSPAFCVAGDSGGHVIMWNGSSWGAPQVVDRASGLAAGTMVTGMSCVGATFCLATDSGGRAFVFNGHAWSTPARVGTGAMLNSVSCASSTFCVAVDATGRVYAYR